MKFNLHYIIIVFTFFIIACYSPSNNKNNTTPIAKIDLDSIKNRGNLKVLINNSSTSYFLYKGKAMGYEYDLLNEFAKTQNLTLDVVPIHNLDSVFENLNKGEADIVAANFTITQERLKKVTFTQPYLITQQVLVQRKKDKKEPNTYITSAIDLAKKTVIVRKESSFFDRLNNLSNEIGDKIVIRTVPGEITMEQLIEQVALGKIDYTIADKNIALVNQWTYPNIDINLTISSDQQIGWAVRKNSDSLLVAINTWLDKFMNTKKFKHIYHKYFSNRHSFNKRLKSDYFTLESGKISPYDSLFKKYAPKCNWDWKLLAAMAYQESHFNNNARGWGGAFGLMQFMPSTGKKYGIDSTSSAEENLNAGVKFIKKLDGIFASSVPDSIERINFVLAAYNVGPGHVLDAQKLAKKYNKNPAVWKNNVDQFLLKKSSPKYYNDSVVKYGYCKGKITYNYVKSIFERYKHYSQLTALKNPELPNSGF